MQYYIYFLNLNCQTWLVTLFLLFLSCMYSHFASSSLLFLSMETRKLLYVNKNEYDLESIPNVTKLCRLNNCKYGNIVIFARN